MVRSGIDIYNKMATGDEGCPILCEKVEYGTTMTKFGKNSMINENKTMLYARYASPKVKIEEEYTLMGANAIISATGGSLGLFLGLSCYGAVWTVFETVEAACNHILSLLRLKKAKARNGNQASLC